MNIRLPKTAFAITGADAQTFLQGQLSNDITKLSDAQVQLNCYMQHQGKIFAILWLVNYEDTLHLIIEDELAESIIQRLTMFRLMSDVVFTQTSLQVVGRTSNEGTYRLNNAQSIDLVASDALSESDTTEWERLSIEQSLPEVYNATSGTFIPQVLNLDEEERGVNFTKGCYIGQEVVARMHYLGKSKRKMYQFSAPFAVAVGDELVVAGSESLRASGVVVRSITLGDTSYFLATLEVKFVESNITINTQNITLLHD